MAAPHVTGLAALLVEDYGKRPGRIKTAIQQSADDLGQRGTDRNGPQQYQWPNIPAYRNRPACSIVHQR